MIFETLKRLFFSGNLSAAALTNALERKWITEEQYKSLIESVANNEQTD